jgi:hypothetical protein
VTVGFSLDDPLTPTLMSLESANTLSRKIVPSVAEPFRL